ncbi:MAG: ATP-binding protein [Bacteroidales bacterium]
MLDYSRKSKAELIAELQRLEKVNTALENIRDREIIESERKNAAELALIMSEEKFHALYSNMIDGLALHTMIYNEQGVPEDYRIIDVNPAFELQLGIYREAVVGKTSRDAYGVSEPPYFEIYSRVAATGKPEVFETYFAPLDKYFSISVYRPYKDSFATVFENITERKKNEAELIIKHEQLQKLNAEKDKLFTIIAHDLKSPFSAIVGFCELLQDQVKEKQYDEIEKSAEIIRQSSQKAMNLLTNLMEWARMQTGRMEFNPVLFELVDYVNEIVDIFEIVARQKFIKIHKELPHNAPVFADKAMLGAILRNLISNAIKFTKPHGMVIISVNVITDGFVVSIKDNGVGICNDNIGKLFKIDESISTLGTNREKGTGFGLILCKEFVEKHGGRIWVESEEGLGSAFYFTLPCL